MGDRTMPARYTGPPCHHDAPNVWKCHRKASLLPRATWTGTNLRAIPLFTPTLPPAPYPIKILDFGSCYMQSPDSFLVSLSARGKRNEVAKFSRWTYLVKHIWKHVSKSIRSTQFCIAPISIFTDTHTMFTKVLWIFKLEYYLTISATLLQMKPSRIIFAVGSWYRCQNLRDFGECKINVIRVKTQSWKCILYHTI